MKKLRILSILLILALFAGMLSACGNKAGNKADWEKSLEVLTFGEVRGIVGDPDVPLKESKIEKDEYHDVTLASVKGTYAVAGNLGKSDDGDLAHTREFNTVIECKDLSLQEILSQLEKDTNLILDHLTTTYGQPEIEGEGDGGIVHHRWTVFIDDTVLLLVTFAVFHSNDISDYSSSPDSLASDTFGDEFLPFVVNYMVYPLG